MAFRRSDKNISLWKSDSTKTKPIKEDPWTDKNSLKMGREKTFSHNQFQMISKSSVGS